ncbi:MAG: SusC/RagA family TonB-linked outer membrane protein, partial [Bacteroidota bacterium]
IKRSKVASKPVKNPQRNRGTPSVNTYLFEGRLQSKEEGIALVGASIKESNGKSGAISDENGNFKLRLNKGEHTISISYFGYKTKLVKINQASQGVIFLEEADQELDEVVIVAVGMKAKRRKLGYAMDILKAEEFSNSQESNLTTALAAKSSGVWVNSSSASPGASANIIIRGFKSISRANKPLIILDGIPIDNSSTGNGTGGVDVSNRLIDLDLHDIESISILKGPAGAALYGIRASNGALILNSKKGQEGKPRIRYSSEIGIEEVNKLPLRQNRYAQGKFSRGQIQYRGPESSVSTSYGPALDRLEFDGNANYPYDQLGALVPVGEGNGVPARTYDPYRSFFVNGVRHSQHLSVSGGTEKLNYYLSGGFLRHDGVVPNSFFNRNSLRSVFGVQVNPRMQIGISTQLTFSQANRMKRGSMFSGVPLGLFRNPVSFDIGNGFKGKEAANTPSSYLLASGDQRAYRGGGRYDNPFWTVNRNPFRDKLYRLIQSLSFDYQLNKWLRISWKGGLDFYSDQRLDAYDIYSGTHPKGQIDETDIVNRNINSDLLLIGERRLGSNWQMKGILGQNYYGADFELKEFRGEELKSPGVYLLDNANSISSKHSKRQKQLFGLFLDLQLSYKNYLHIDVSGRNDWSSTLAKGNRSFFYPSFSSAFELSEALGFKADGTFSYLKLKASASSSGNDAASFLTNTYFDFAVADGDDLLPGLRFPAFGITALERSTLLGNANLLAEQSTALEFGLEFHLFGGRMKADINAFKSVSKGQIVRTQMSATTGFLTAPRNTGKIINKGIEIDLYLQLIRKRKFFWEMDFAFSHVRSMVSDLPANMPQITLASFTAVSSNIIISPASFLFTEVPLKTP